MGYGDQLVAHGICSIASTILNKQDFDTDIIEAAFAHIGENEVRNAYNRAKYIKPSTPMMVWWSEHIDASAIEGISSKGTKGLVAIN
jgi:hypothetical protein